MTSQIIAVYISKYKSGSAKIWKHCEMKDDWHYRTDTLVSCAYQLCYLPSVNNTIQYNITDTTVHGQINDTHLTTKLTLTA